MSHKATSWLSEQTGLSASEFRVLFHLCDCHNPAKGCFPEQRYLIEKCELGSSALNEALLRLETKGKIRRVRRFDPVTKQARSTLYILGCDPEFFSVSDSGKPDMADSGFPVKPTPVLAESRLRPTGDKPVKGTSKRTSKDLFGSDEPQSPRDALPASEAKAENTGSDFTEFWEAYPKAPRKTDKPKAKASFDRIVAGKAKGIGSVRPETIIAAVKRYAASAPDPDFVPLPTTWLNGARWEQWAEAPKPKPAAYRSPSDWMNEAARRDPCPDHGRFA